MVDSFLKEFGVAKGANGHDGTLTVNLHAGDESHIQIDEEVLSTVSNELLRQRKKLKKSKKKGKAMVNMEKSSNQGDFLMVKSFAQA